MAHVDFLESGLNSELGRYTHLVRMENFHYLYTSMQAVKGVEELSEACEMCKQVKYAMHNLEYHALFLSPIEW